LVGEVGAFLETESSDVAVDVSISIGLSSVPTTFSILIFTLFDVDAEDELDRVFFWEPLLFT